MKFLFLPYACAEKFRAAKIGAINVPLSPEASMAEFYAAKREDAMKFLEFFCKRAERELEILKFLGARRFGLQAASERESEILKFNAAEHLKSRAAPQKQAAGLLKLASEPPHNRSKILNFMPKPRDRFRILQPTYALVCLAGAVRNFISQHRFRILKFVPGCVHYTYIAQNFASQCEFKILKFIHELPHALRNALTRALRCTSLRADKAEAGRAARLTSQHTHDATEKRSAVKFNHAGGLDSAQRHIARLCSAAARHGYEVGRAENFSKFDLTGALLNFTSRFAMQLCSAVTRRNYEAWRSEIYAVCLHKYPALIRAASGKISRYEVGQATNASLSQGVQRMKFCAQKRHAIKFLKFLGARRFGLQVAVGRGFEILKFMRASARLADTAQNFISQRGLRILKLIRALPRASRRTLPRADKAEAGRAARLTSQHTHDATEKRSAVKINEYLNSAWRRIALCSAAARHGYEAGRAENFSKFDLTGALLNFISLPSHKFKPASIPLLNFISNFTPHASASKFENGIKFKGAAKFERSAR